ncbi:fimbrial protein [Escherichia coli]|uniref:fimbrial protein n=1 Tax=Escherichia coli TaxID=562 RepID=UPI0003EF2399|nr:fimbrial protein [Escherichia coli]EZD98612.1 fimbrial protein [Escherichia coli O145:H28 str. 2009C-3292]KDV35509.1 fimbrial protein [Escherichia coli O145:H25 str. 07-3858]
MKKSVLTAFITVVCATSSVMAADDNAITDGKVTFNGKVIAPACTLVAATKDSVVTLPNVSATKLQTNGAVSGVKTDVPIALEGCDVTVTKNATFTFSGTADGVQPTAFANQATTDAATNVALQMYLPDGSTSVTPLVFWRGYSYFLRVTIYENLHNKGNCDRKFNGNITQLLIRMGGR